MTHFSLSPTVGVRFEGELYRLVQRQKDGEEFNWFLRRLQDGKLLTIPEFALLEAYNEGRLEAHLDFGDISQLERKERLKRRRTNFDDLSEDERARLVFRRAFLREVERRWIPGAMYSPLPEPRAGCQTVLDAVLMEVGNQLGKRVSASTFHRWKSVSNNGLEPRELIGRFALRGRRDQLDQVAREAISDGLKRLLDAAKDKQEVGAPLIVTIDELKKAAENSLNVARMLNPGRRLEVPSKTTLYKMWNALPAFDRDVAKYGEAEARQRYRSVKGHDRPEAAMDIGEYDETELPFFFWDEQARCPLGRAWLSWLIDVFSHSILGFYIGFEPVSDLMMNSAFRHCCLPKTYVPQLYRDTIRGRMDQYGLFRKIRVDNSKPAWGRTAEELALQTDIDWEMAPVRQPYLKPHVEGMFKRLNAELLRLVPGFVLPGFERSDYDPAKQGCIGFHAFLHIFHKWVIDVYHNQRQEALGASPNEKFAEGTRIVSPGLLDSARNLRTIFGIVRDGTLDHRGLLFKGIRYISPELHKIRLRHGHKLSVKVKIDPGDLGSIHAFDPKNKEWVEAMAVPDADAKGLSLHMHEIICGWARERYNSTDDGLRRTARRELSDLITSYVMDPGSVKGMSLVARAAGIGTHNIFDTRGHDGHIDSVRGPFALNPVQERQRDEAPASKIERTDGTRQPDEGASQATLKERDRTRTPEPISGTKSPRRRPSLDLQSDHSLSSTKEGWEAKR